MITSGFDTRILEPKVTRQLGTATLPAVVTPEQHRDLLILQKRLDSVELVTKAGLQRYLERIRAKLLEEPGNNKLKIKVERLECVSSILDIFIHNSGIYPSFREQILRAGLNIKQAEKVMSGELKNLSAMINAVLEIFDNTLWAVSKYYYPEITVEIGNSVTYKIMQIWLAQIISELIDNVVVTQEEMLES